MAGRGAKISGEVQSKYFKVIGLWQFVVDKEVTWWVVGNLVLGGAYSVNTFIQVVETLIGGHELSVFAEKFTVNIIDTGTIIKIIYYCVMRRKLKLLSSCFKKDLLLCSHHNEETTDSIMSSGYTIVNRLTKSFMITCFLTAVIWIFVPIITCLLSGDCSEWKIIPAWYPEAISNPVFTYIYECYLMIFCGAIIYNVNCFFTALSLSLSSQFELLGKSMELIPVNAQQMEGSKMDNMDTLLRECLIDHQTLLKLSKELEEFYNPIVLFQMMFSTITICLALVQINVHLSSDEFPDASICNYLTYYLSVSTELLMYSWGGQKLKDQSGSLHSYLYSSGWDDASEKFKKNVAIALIKTVKEEFITAGKFYVVDLASFAGIMKASYSYFTFLHGSDSIGS